MAVLIRMISVVVPTAKIGSCYEPDGYSGYLKKFKKSQLKWHDQHLMVTSMHDPEFVAMEIEYWEKLGLVSVESKTWIDMCVVDQTGGPTLPCDWLEWDKQNGCVWLKGTERGDIAGPADPSITAGAVHLTAKALDQADATVVQSRPWWKFWGK